MAGGEPRPPLALVGDGTFRLKVVGTSYRQHELNMMFGPKKPRGVKERVVAELLPEPGNPYDGNAIAVVIDDQHVVYLSRSDAAAFCETGNVGRALTARGLVVGGWFDQDGREGHFGVRIDAADPFTFSEPPLFSKPPERLGQGATA